MTPTTSSGMFRLNLSDFQKALVMAVFVGILMPVAAVVQAPGFDVLHANWLAIGDIALTGAVTGFIGYLAKNFLSDSAGAVFGKIGGYKGS